LTIIGDLANHVRATRLRRQVLFGGLRHISVRRAPVPFTGASERVINEAMSGISPTSGTTSSLTSTLSSVGKSLLTSGSAPNAVPAAATTSSSTGLSSYQSEYDTLQTEDTQELLYASFLTPAESLANGNAVLQQAAALLGAPGSLASSQSTSAAAASSTPAPDPLANLPSVASILAASDAEAQQTLTNYANAPVGSSIIDYQA
jgi:hypothetical protein